MVILIINIALFSLLAIIYFILRKRMGEHILFDISFLYKYLYLFSPILIFIVNIVYTFIFEKEGILYSFLPLSIPFFHFCYRAVLNMKNEKEYSELENVIIPLILGEFNKRNLGITSEQISIQILDPEERGTKKLLNIVLHITEKNPQIIDVKNIISRETKMMFQSRYITKVIVREPYKKKNNVKYIVN
ncbi:hypothetical protein [Bacillus toyonensis]|uniref:hypothetical protein n=1 Tax=Bacillus toyonensis TaxID=155322 RepID=UPI0035DBA7E8